MSQEATEESRRTWNAAAPGWERYRGWLFEQQRTVSERLIATMAPNDGDIILELTAGPGETGLLLAERAPHARVIVSDFAPLMVLAARAEADRRGLRNVECREIDAQSIDLGDASVHGIMSRYGMMLVPDREAAFAEIRRVLVPGSPLAYAVWGPLQANPWMSLFGAVFVARGHFTPPDDAVFPLTTEEENRAVVTAAGFERIHVEVVEEVMTYDGVDHYWDVSVSVAGPLALIAHQLPPEEIAAMRALLTEFAASFESGSRLSFPSQTLVVRAS